MAEKPTSHQHRHQFSTNLQKCSVEELLVCFRYGQVMQLGTVTVKIITITRRTDSRFSLIVRFEGSGLHGGLLWEHGQGENIVRHSAMPK
jgi:hypothetical protein